MNITHNQNNFNRLMTEKDIKSFIQNHLNFFDKLHLTNIGAEVQKCRCHYYFFSQIGVGINNNTWKIWLPKVFEDLDLNAILKLCLENKDLYSPYDPHKYAPVEFVEWNWMPCTLKTLIVFDYLINEKYNKEA